MAGTSAQDAGDPLEKGALAVLARAAPEAGAPKHPICATPGDPKSACKPMVELIEVYRAINKLLPCLKRVEGAVHRARGEISSDALQVGRTYHHLCARHSTLRARAEALRTGMSDVEHERALASV